MKLLSAVVRVCSLVFFLPGLPGRSQAPAAVVVSGTVEDPSGAVIPKASVHLQGSAGDQTVDAGALGRFTLSVTPGSYELTVQADGFKVYRRPGFIVQPGRDVSLSIKLQIATTEEEVNVPSEPEVSTDADSNKSALVFKGDQLDTLSDDPALMQQQLQAIGGGDPTNPAQVYVDGFSNGTMPPKQSIREIRINQNPFTAQNDQFGMGRIDVFTKPGSNQLHGNVEVNYGNSALNARNPYTGAQPPYSNDYSVANLSGPIGKKSSFFFTAQRSDLSQNEVVNAVVLDSNLNPVPLSEPLANQVVSQSYSTRFDRQFGAADTFIGRYTFSNTTQPAAGAGLLVLPSQAYSSALRTQTVQLTDTHVFGPKVVWDAALQYSRAHLEQNPASSDVSLVVQGAFSGGGSPSQMLHDETDRMELRQYFTIAEGKHLIRTGLRYRLLRDANLPTAGYNGQFVFPDIDTYRNTLLDLQNGLSGAAIRAKGDGASQFSLTAGTPSAAVLTGDFGVYGEDEWKARPDLTLNYGLRVEGQSAIPSRIDLAPRVGFAYSMKLHKNAKTPAVVVRGGFGVFHQRFASGDILRSIRQNGVTQQVYFVTDPDFFPVVPDPSSLAAVPPTVYRINPLLHSPMQMQGMMTAEHSFGKYGTVALNYYQRRTFHQFESLNLNAPLPGTSTRPLGDAENIYEYSSDGVSSGRTLGVNTNINAGKRMNVWAYFGVGHQETDTSGADSFPSNSYDLRADRGEYPGYTPRALYSGINLQPGWGTAFNFFFSVRSHSNFNITTGQDNNGDSIYNDRPAFATDLSRASVVRTAYGDFDTDPLPGQTIIPINYGRSPGFLYLEMYFHKDVHFGPRPAAATAPGGQGTPAADKKAELPPPRYNLQFGIGADNLLNTVNPGTPVGILTSPFFGRSISLNAPFTNNTAANRAVTLRCALFF